MGGDVAGRGDGGGVEMVNRGRGDGGGNSIVNRGGTPGTTRPCSAETPGAHGITSGAQCGSGSAESCDGHGASTSVSRTTRYT